MNKLLGATLALTIGVTVNAKAMPPDIRRLLYQVSHNTTLICKWERGPMRECFENISEELLDITEKYTVDCGEDKDCFNEKSKHGLEEYIKNQEDTLNNIQKEKKKLSSI